MSLTVIYGCMGSGKTTQLIKIARSMDQDNQILVIKHVFDNRFSESQSVICTHNHVSYPVECYNTLSEIPNYKIRMSTHILIDEGQFFTDLFECTTNYRKLGKHVYVAGLDKTSMDEPFGQIPMLVDCADLAEHYFAICSCSREATHTYRKRELCTSGEYKKTILIGGMDIYEAVCSKCFYERMPHLRS